MSTNPNQLMPPPAHPELEVPANVQIAYANLVRISHTPSELIFDFAHLLPGATSAQVCSRIVMSPLGAKLLHRALSENLTRYEAAFGEIKIPGEPASLANFLFRPPAPPTPPPGKE